MLILFSFLFALGSARLLYYQDFKDHPYSISYDYQSFLIDGKRTLLLGGAVHYPRLSVSEWRPTFQKMREDGLNFVDTYFFWNLHEPSKGVFDWGEGTRNDFVSFIRTAGEEGLFVVFRLGPYVCAEWKFGGLPTWVTRIPGIRLRSANSEWQSLMQKVLSEVVNRVTHLLASNGGPIIMLQIENEQQVHRPEYVAWCGSLALNLTRSVPWLMCNGDSAQGTINSCNGDDCFDYALEHDSEWSDEPLVWTENEQWFQTWAGPTNHANRTAEDMAYVLSKWIMVGGSYHSYYMYYGGNTLGDYSGLMVTPGYAQGAILKSDGSSNEPKRAHLRRLSQVLGSLSTQILQGDRKQRKPVIVDNVEIWKFSEELVFLYNPTGIDKYISFDYVKFRITKTSVLIVVEGKVVFDTSTITSKRSKEATERTLAIVSASSWRSSSVKPKNFQPIKAPIAHSQLTDSSVLYYRFEPQGELLSSNSISFVARGGGLFYVFIGEEAAARVVHEDTSRDMREQVINLEIGTIVKSITIMSVLTGIECFFSGEDEGPEPALRTGILKDFKVNNKDIKGIWSWTDQSERIEHDYGCFGPRIAEYEVMIETKLCQDGQIILRINDFKNEAIGRISVNGLDLGFFWTKLVKAPQTDYIVPNEAILTLRSEETSFTLRAHLAHGCVPNMSLICQIDHQLVSSIV